MAAPVLMFGIGATKAGTSWLHSYLDGHGECAMSAIKELHYFDAVDFGERALQVEALEKTRAGIAHRLEVLDDGKHDWRRRWLADCERYLPVLREGSEADYLDYLFGAAGEARLVGDVTPSYALLDEARIARMADLAEEVRFVYLLRDPVERLWSHARMLAGRWGRDHSPERDEERARNILRRTLRGDEPLLADRSDYASVLYKLAAVNPAKVLVGFYEEMFTEGWVAKLCGFLGLRVEPAPLATKVNSSQAMSLPEHLRARAARMLAPQYEAVRDYMGRLPEPWNANMEAA